MTAEQLDAGGGPGTKVVELMGRAVTTAGDWADTAGVVANLHLVISVDTAVAHLAGVMDKPVWLALSAAADWRWLRGRSDSPWYPKARLFRQSELGSWEPVFAEMGRVLRELAGADRAW